MVSCISINRSISCDPDFHRQKRPLFWFVKYRNRSPSSCDAMENKHALLIEGLLYSPHHIADGLIQHFKIPGGCFNRLMLKLLRLVNMAYFIPDYFFERLYQSLAEKIVKKKRKWPKKPAARTKIIPDIRSIIRLMVSQTLYRFPSGKFLLQMKKHTHRPCTNTVTLSRILSSLKILSRRKGSSIFSKKHIFPLSEYCNCQNHPAESSPAKNSSIPS